MRGEGPSFNMLASATGLAKMAAYMANNGSFGVKQLLSPDTIQEFHSNPDTKVQLPFGMRATFTRGGAFDYNPKHLNTVARPQHTYINGFSNEFEHHCTSTRNGWYGWMGLGGSVMQWHPELKIGFGYATTDLFATDMANYRIGIL